MVGVPTDPWRLIVNHYVLDELHSRLGRPSRPETAIRAIPVVQVPDCVLERILEAV